MKNSQVLLQCHWGVKSFSVKQQQILPSYSKIKTVLTFMQIYKACKLREIHSLYRMQ